MSWYGFLLIFLTVLIFCNFLYAVRLDFTTQNALIEHRFPLPEGQLQILDRPEEKTLSAATMPRQPLILFFFASWCRPCMMEIPTLTKLAKRNDVPFIGIAARDKPEKIKSLLEKTGNPFVMIGLDPNTDWTRQMNADKLPTAFILNAKGEVVARIKGLMTEDFYLKTVLPFLQELKNEKPL